MQNPAHLTDEQLHRYRTHTLDPAELLDVDDHISICETCRGRAAELLPFTASARKLRAELTAHLEYGQIVACAEGTASPELEAHFAECAMCRAEVADLRQFRSELQAAPKVVVMKRRWWVAAGIAAALLLAAALAVRQPHRAQPAPVAERPLSPEQRQVLDLAMTTHRLERAPVLDQLIRQRSELLGAPPARTFQLTAPLGTVVLTDRPVFRWSNLAGATRYVVSIFDENFDKVLESPALTATEWQPETALPPGKVYVWQVTAQFDGETVHAPMPPDPEARFEVAAPSVATEIDAARHDHPGNHLLLAALYAHAGALDDAAREIDILAKTQPAEAASLRASLAQIRHE